LREFVAVLDIGKTNIKVLAFDPDGKIVWERTRRNAPLLREPTCPYLHLDTEGVWAFLMDALRDLAAAVPVGAISISTHGAAGVLVDDAGPVLPPIDYDADELEGEAAEYAAVRPAFAETSSPALPRGLNLGRQLFHLFRHHPTEAARARAFLTYPQYWAWRLCGVMASEVTSLGCHTDLWAPYSADFSSMVDRMGWRPLFPPLRKAWDALGPIKPEIAASTGLRADVRVLCGGHDSNCALAPYLTGRTDPFTVVSTGTWVIVFAIGGRATLDLDADMLANVDVRGKPTPSARFMGGREFAVLAGDAPAQPTLADIEAVVASRALALPSFSDQGGPFARRAGRITGPEPRTPEASAALATLYTALMTELLVERLSAAGDVIVEGGFTKSPTFAALLAALMSSRRVLLAASASGAAEGAAALARWGQKRERVKTYAAPPWTLSGLAGYRERWRAEVAA
jgi:sugar (pentulose or hexulose) kinase